MYPQLPRAQNDGGTQHESFLFFFVGGAHFCDHRALLHTYIKVRVNRKLLPILLEYGDVFQTFLRSSSHLSLAAN